jgi:hypothetical protein
MRSRSASGGKEEVSRDASDEGANSLQDGASQQRLVARLIYDNAESDQHSTLRRPKVSIK